MSNSEFILSYNDMCYSMACTVTKEEIEQKFNVKNAVALKLEDGSLFDITTEPTAENRKILADAFAILQVNNEAEPVVQQQATAQKRGRESDGLDDVHSAKRTKLVSEQLENAPLSADATLSLDQQHPLQKKNKKELQKWLSQQPQELRAEAYEQFWNSFVDKLNECPDDQKVVAFEHLLHALHASILQERNSKTRPIETLFAEPLTRLFQQLQQVQQQQQQQ